MKGGNERKKEKSKQIAEMQPIIISTIILNFQS